MRQKLKLAQALAHDPDVLFLDEPLNGMDPVSRHQAIEAIRELGADGRTVLVSSHILPEVEEMTRHVVLIHRGKVLAEGDVAEIRDLIPEYPTVVALRRPRPRDLASFLVGQDTSWRVACRRRRPGRRAHRARAVLLPRSARWLLDRGRPWRRSTPSTTTSSRSSRISPRSERT